MNNISRRTTNQASNLAKSMCHEILKEEDDEVESLDDVAGDCATKAHLDDLLDEQNGNISAKLTSLTLNDNANDDDSVAGLNGNTIANDSNRISATKIKKKAKKGTNSINTGKLSTTIECDSNENKVDTVEGSNESALEASDDRLEPSGDLIKDDVVNVNA